MNNSSTEHNETLDVIAVGAHPDDVEVACGGTLASLVRQGYRVGIVDLTDGEPTPNCPSPAVRIEESQQAANALGVAKRIQLDLPNRKLFDAPEPRIALAKVFRLYRPKLVIGFGDKTPMASPDHWQAMQITDGAIFYSRLCKWDDPFDGLPPHTIDRHLYFRMALEPDSIPYLSHHITVDITETLDAKIKSVACYQTQFAHRPGIIDRVRAAAIVTGSAAGVQYAESFAAAKPFAVQDLMKTVIDPV
ncbi:1D-myo-inositol 2-acetamido-2-deoxy-alpha-D-glucopyranoside deacetylase [Rubripirellula obstinata]|uniref:1D-myo-inositol 2-acetamido-2-deoxy-alpha-D-glucopyranoside deacetylase n=1 Tax=Rubripirellula obstinata TaxID=406547 RepID=A0A5B1CE93_9BACT|nr:PIG-L family deacetylase [Rubripirellula obstinata]KAA1257910.1 1D-myo-inositol 2-acetamido-2-deoxy-alpha-D-glucopyranoside deacetylase [Rubripirellula obstinata]